MKYLNFGAQNVDIHDSKSILDAYNNGFVMTRVSLGHMEKVRSIRVDLSQYNQSSENKRILKKFNHLLFLEPVPLQEYDWHIHKIGKEFYENKFGKDIFSANKIKEILTTQFNFNLLLKYIDSNESDGFCISLQAEYEGTRIIHYAYPFYKLQKANSNFGMFMMTLAVTYFQALGYRYIYLGSCHDQKARYKLQFRGIEWFDEKVNQWKTDLHELKNRLLLK
ncbi:MAG: hypothetical protein KatS3mg084_0633 [Candidatus Dojkabacteria bacterium]|nr:MAG: hypothetical protein KatS3mg084_0633 [Candidatus Dojkabacteria bacterium]